MCSKRKHRIAPNLYLQYNHDRSVCQSKHPYVCTYVRPAIFNMYQLLPTYFYGTKN